MWLSSSFVTAARRVRGRLPLATVRAMTATEQGIYDVRAFNDACSHRVTYGETISPPRSAPCRDGKAATLGAARGL